MALQNGLHIRFDLPMHSPMMRHSGPILMVMATEIIGKMEPGTAPMKLGELDSG